MDVSSLMQQNALQNTLPAVESSSCFEMTATEKPVEIPNGDSNQKNVNSEEKNTSAIPQIAPINQEELQCAKTTYEQSITTQHAMPAVHPELSLPNYTNFSRAVLFTGQTPANTLNTKLTGLFTVPTPCVGHVRNPLTLVAPIVKGAIQPTAVASTRIPMESSAVRLANMCGKMPIAACLPTKLSSSGPSYEQLCNKALPVSITQPRGKQPCFTTTETSSFTAVPHNLNNSSTPGSALDMNQSQQQAQVNTESHTATTPDSQCIYTNTGNQASSTPSIAETHPIQAPVPGVHVTSQPEKMTESTKLIPEFQSGKVDAKKFRPRYYDINSLEIGTWRYQRKMFSRDKSRLKVIFSQRKFVYEFQLYTNTEELVLARDDKPMACIEIPFRTVVGLNISTSPTVDVVIEVDTVPAMWQGTEVLQQRHDGTTCSRVQYNTLHAVDLTDGQLSKVPYHKLTISSTSIVIRNHLMNFDPRFSALLRIPIKIDCNKPPPAALKPEKSSKRKKEDHDSTSEESPVHAYGLESNPKSQRCVQTNDWQKSLKVCSCTSGCTSKRCSCIKEHTICQGCSCVSCNNPLNVLEEFGVNLAEACNDSCLMQNLPKISNLRALLRNSTVATPCCDSRIPLSNCCTGEVECPDCDAEYRFSWCSRDLCDEEDRPRNHCAICQTCRDYRDQHCSRCNRCYFAGSYDYPCPCRGGNQHGRFSFLF